MRRQSSIVLLVVATSLVGCASQSRDQLAAAPRGDTFSAEEIARSGFTNAWDFLSARARRYNFYEDQFGHPRGIKTRRGRSTINLADSDTPLILVDGARLNDCGALRDLRTDAISSIELENGITGTAAQGTNAAAGVIYIHTWEASGG